EDDGNSATHSALQSVQNEVEDVEIMQSRRACSLGIVLSNGMRDNEGNGLLGKAAMGAQPLASKLRKVVVACPGAKREPTLRDDDDVRFAILRKIEPAAGFLTRERQLYAFKRADKGHDAVAFDAIPHQVDTDEASQCPVMAHEGIGDGADDAGRAGAKLRIQYIAQIK